MPLKKTFEKEKAILREKLPTEGKDYVDLETIAEAIQAVNERQVVADKIIKELEANDLFLDALNKFFLIQKKIRKSRYSEEELKELADLLFRQKIAYAEHDKMSQASIVATRAVVDKCPVCGSSLILRPINIPKGKKNVFGYKSSWFCDCGYEDFSHEDYSKLSKELIEKASTIRTKVYKDLKKLLTPSGTLPKSLVCPKCGKNLQLIEIKAEKGNKNRHGYKCMKSCFNCGHEEFFVKPYQVMLKRIKKEIKHGNLV